MSHIIAYGPNGVVRMECHSLMTAKNLASAIMRYSNEFGKVEIFDINGEYHSTAWGE